MEGEAWAAAMAALAVEFGAEAGAHGAERAEVLGERAGVDALDAEDAVAGEVFGERLAGAPVGRDLAEFADDEGADVRPGGFGVLRVDPVVADLRVGHRDDLAAVGGIGDDLLVSGHRGVETNFPGGGSGGSEGGSFETASVFKG